MFLVLFPEASIVHVIDLTLKNQFLLKNVIRYFHIELWEDVLVSDIMVHNTV